MKRVTTRTEQRSQPTSVSKAKGKSVQPAKQKLSAKKPVTNQPTAATAAKKAPPPARRRAPAARADLGAPIDGFFLKQPPGLRAILDELRQLVEQIVPRAVSAIKWGNPFYTLDGVMLCAFSAHKSHVNLILAGPPGTFVDPHARLTGEGKTGRHLKLTSLDQLPREEVRGWLRAAAEHAAREA